MFVLAMDTSTQVMGIAILDASKKKLLAEVTINRFQNHSSSLIPTIERAFKDLDITMKDISLLAVTNGPGSYTGLRIGVATAKTFSWSCNIPLYSESSLKILAMNGLWFDGLIVPLFDARRGRVYSGVYKANGNLMDEVLPQQVIAFNDWIEQIKGLQKPVLFLGDDVSLFHKQIVDDMGENAHFGLEADNIPRASFLAKVAYEKWSDDQPHEKIDFAPNYLQITEAEAKLCKGKEGV